jgi:hypothetical protein
VCRPYLRRSGALMPNFIFEIIRAGDDPQVVGELSLPDFAAAWCNVETLAFKLRKTESEAFIRVKDSKGRIVAFAGICTALISYEKCNRRNCPLKPASDREP